MAPNLPHMLEIKKMANMSIWTPQKRETSGELAGRPPIPAKITPPYEAVFTFSLAETNENNVYALYCPNFAKKSLKFPKLNQVFIFQFIC